MLFNVSIAMLSLKYGVGGTSKVDIICFVGSLLSAVLWFVTKNPVVGLTSIVIIGIIGSIPTLVKVYNNPKTESSFVWSSWFLANIINLLAIKSWTYAIAVYPLESTVMIGLITIFVLRKYLPQRTKIIFS